MNNQLLTISVKECTRPHEDLCPSQGEFCRSSPCKHLQVLLYRYKYKYIHGSLYLLALGQASSPHNRRCHRQCFTSKPLSHHLQLIKKFQIFIASSAIKYLRSTHLRSYLHAQIYSNHWHQVPMQTWTIESYLCCPVLGVMICTVIEENGAPHSQSDIGFSVSLLNWLVCPIQGRGEENVHWERQVHMKSQNSSRRGVVLKLENSLC